MRLSDKITGSFLIVLGGLAAYGGSRLPPVPGQQVGPNVFPILIGLSLIACGAMIALGIGRRFEEEAEAELAAIEGPQPASESKGRLFGLRALLPPALLIFYVVGVEKLGFIPTAAIITFITSLALGARLRLAIPVAMLAPIGAHLVFYKLLRVPLPAGLLPMPW